MYFVHNGIPAGCFINSHMYFVHNGIPAGCFIDLHMFFVHNGMLESGRLFFHLKLNLFFFGNRADPALT